MKKFVPDQEGTGLKKDMQNNLTSILLKLAKMDAYTDSGELIGTDGSPVPDTSISKLLSYACRSEPFLAGVPEFCSLLRAAGIYDLPNQNIESLVTGEMSYPPRPRSRTPLQVTSPPPTQPVVYVTPPPPSEISPPAERSLPPPPPLRRMVPPDDGENGTEDGSQVPLPPLPPRRTLPKRVPKSIVAVKRKTGWQSLSQPRYPKRKRRNG